mmetsp:Transcript_11977/g.16484  ORF Transcript_11977/g.16484 Transcript_11977/m.16484 type:complete len:118 (-) Transcript_11977:391-744(-)
MHTWLSYYFLYIDVFKCIQNVFALSNFVSVFTIIISTFFFLVFVLCKSIMRNTLITLEYSINQVSVILRGMNDLDNLWVFFINVCVLISFITDFNHRWNKFADVNASCISKFLQEFS